MKAVAIKSDPKLRLAQVISAATWWMEFPEQWHENRPAWTGMCAWPPTLPSTRKH